LGEICRSGGGSIQTGPFGSQLHADDYKDDGVPIITVEHLQEGRIAHKNLPLVGAADRQRLRRYSLAVGDLVFSRVGAIDRCALVSKAEDGWLFSGRCLRVRAGAGRANPLYLSYQLNSWRHRRWILNHSVGSTMACLNTSILSALPVNLPLPPEQRYAAAILSTIDEAIERTEALIAKYEQIKSGLMHDLFTRGVTPDGRLRPPRSEAPHLYKKSSIGWLPEEWEVFAIKAITHLCVDCPHSTPVLAEDGYPMARTSEISDGVLDLDVSPKVALTEYQFRTGRAVPTAGDIIFTREAPVGEAFVVPRGLQICLGQRVMLMRPNRRRCDPDFLLFQIYSAAVQKEFLRIVGGTTNPHLNVEDVRNFEIALPSVEEQARITARLLALDDLIASEKRNGQKLRVSKDGLMHNLLTGRVRVKIEELAAT
jgi:type I restriction enzyme S subunit